MTTQLLQPAVLLSSLLLGLLSASLASVEPAPRPLLEDREDAPTPHPGDALHARFDRLLSDYVSEGWVDYTGLKQEGRADLRAYLAELEATDPATLDRDETFAFWINAYNAFTLELILDHLGKIKGIKDISSSKRWDAKRWKVNGQTYSLDQIEHEILRPMGDARVHFGLVCASKSCPDLLEEAFLPSRIDEQLQAAGDGFLADSFKGLNTTTEDGWFGGKNYVVTTSKIFSWFDDDFERDAGTVLDYLLRHAPETQAAFIRKHRGDIDLEHFDYDWTLNGR